IITSPTVTGVNDESVVKITSINNSGIVATTIQRLARNVRLVFDYLGMTENSRRRRGRPATAG
ncbi:hypothetical protein, partial [uncultured Thiodictyon sp.]|uniref:hypothetical protein n=1 Tax=uncultured Thiodictyon sp. TaxID=1846217 RepID=UPI0025EC757A